MVGYMSYMLIHYYGICTWSHSLIYLSTLQSQTLNIKNSYRNTLHGLKRKIYRAKQEILDGT